jgi:hypothetical protein
MLSNLTQYSPQGLMPQFPGLQTAGLPQMNQGLFAQGQPSPYNGHSQFGYESGQAGPGQQFPLVGQPLPFGGQIHPLLQHPFSPGQFSASPFAPNPYQQSPWQQSPGGHNPQQNSFVGHLGQNVQVQQIVPVLAQLAQQIAVQGAVAQQIGIAIHQLAHQLAAQGLGAGQSFATTQPFIGSAAQPFGLGGPILGNPAAQYFGPNSFSNTPQGGYGGFSPQQAQAWGANRPQTIQ